MGAVHVSFANLDDGTRELLELTPCSNCSSSSASSVALFDVRCTCVSRHDFAVLQRWYFLASNFTKYFRMMVVHLGILGWQQAFSPTGVSPATEKV